MDLCKRMVVQMLKRKFILNVHLCPDSTWVEDDDYKTALKKLALCKRNILKLSGEMDKVEQGQGKGEIGARALLDVRPLPHHIRAAICLLVAARFNESMSREADEVTEVISLAAGRSAQAAYELRTDFELSRGLLRPHLNVIRYGMNIDRWHCYLRETSLAKLLGREPCGELSAMELVHGTTSNVNTGERSLLM